MSYKAGTVTTVANNATITGANTQWANSLYNVVKGQIIVITQGTNTDIYTIEEVKSNTSILLSRPAVRAATNATYEILTTLNNSVSDDTIKLGNEIVAMSDFMRIMQAWTTSTQNTVKVTWGSQEITIATVAGLQKQIDNKISASGDNNISQSYPTTSEVAAFLMDRSNQSQMWRHSTNTDYSTSYSSNFLSRVGDCWFNIAVNWQTAQTVIAAGNGSKIVKRTIIDQETTGWGKESPSESADTNRNTVLSYSSLPSAAQHGIPSIGAGIQTVYASNRRAQIFVTTGRRIMYRFSMSAGADTTTEWRTAINLGEYGFGACADPSMKDFEFTPTPPTVNDADSAVTNGIYGASGDGSANFYGKYSPLFVMGRQGQADGTGVITQMQIVSGKIATRQRALMKWTNWSPVVHAGDFGLGETNINLEKEYGSNQNFDLQLMFNSRQTGLYSWGGVRNSPNTNKYNFLINQRWGMHQNAAQAILGTTPDGDLFHYGKVDGSVWSGKTVFYSTKNTTKDSNGNLKAASPVVKLFTNRIELNEESEGVEMEHLGIGHYLIKGVVGFNSDGAWGINNGFVIPQDHNGKNMVLIDYKVRPDGDIEVFVFHQQNADLPERFQNKRIKHIDEDGNPVYYENYEPCDVPESRWIDMRVEMPVNSVYNLKQVEAKAEAERLAKEEAEAERLAKEEADRQTEEVEKSETQPDDM